MQWRLQGCKPLRHSPHEGFSAVVHQGTHAAHSLVSCSKASSCTAGSQDEARAWQQPSGTSPCRVVARVEHCLQQASLTSPATLESSVRSAHPVCKLATCLMICRLAAPMRLPADMASTKWSDHQIVRTRWISCAISSAACDSCRIHCHCTHVVVMFWLSGFQ